MSDPQEEQDIPQRWLDRADELMQERIETSVDEEAYADGDWTEKITELAAELWAEAEEEEKIARADHEIEQAKEKQ